MKPQEKPSKPLTAEQVKQLEKEKMQQKLTGQTINKNEPGNTKPKR